MQSPARCHPPTDRMIRLSCRGYSHGGDIVGELIGLKGIFVDNPDRVGEAWDEAFSADRPVILEADTDPNVPPLPPHITLKQARNFLSMIPSEPELGSVAEEQRQGTSDQRTSRKEMRMIGTSNVSKSLNGATGKHAILFVTQTALVCVRCGSPSALRGQANPDNLPIMPV